MDICLHILDVESRRMGRPHQRHHACHTVTISSESESNILRVEYACRTHRGKSASLNLRAYTDLCLVHGHNVRDRRVAVNGSDANGRASWRRRSEAEVYYNDKSSVGPPIRDVQNARNGELILITLRPISHNS
jgi:hypothetical protein